MFFAMQPPEVTIANFMHLGGMCGIENHMEKVISVFFKYWCSHSNVICKVMKIINNGIKLKDLSN